VNLRSGTSVVLAPEIARAAAMEFQQVIVGSVTARPVPHDPSAVHGPDRPIPGAGFFASHAVKSYRAGVLAYLDGGLRECIDRMTVVVASERDVSSARLFAGLAAIALDEPSIAATHLEALLVAGPPLPDRFQAQFAARDQVTIDVHIRLSDGIAAQAPFAEAAALLALVQLYRDEGRHRDAIALLQQVATSPLHPVLQLSLADAVAASGDNQGVIDVTQGVVNTHDIAVELLRLRARAFLALGLQTAAQEAFRAALARSAGRDPGLLCGVRYERALALEESGQRARARADYERIYAIDPDFEDVRERIASLR
jgi:tetratricopeptide (TPR) repeat protein